MPQQEWKYEKNKIAPPTVGRVVYYYHPNVDQPMAAIVASVSELDGYTVNIGFLRPDGTGSPACSVPHVSMAVGGDRPYWDWMPFQKGQAAKTEELQRELEARSK